MQLLCRIQRIAMGMATNYAELVTHSTNPNDSDSDDDGLTDEEKSTKGRPNLADSDYGVSERIHRSDRSLRWQFHTGQDHTLIIHGRLEKTGKLGDGTTTNRAFL